MPSPAGSPRVSKTGNYYELATAQDHHLIDQAGIEMRQSQVGEKHQSAEVIRETMYAKFWRLRRIGGVCWRRIDADFIAGFGQSVCDHARVIADASRLRRILAGNNVPCCHSAGDITSTTGGPGRIRPMDRLGRSRVRRAVHAQRESFRRRRG